MSWGDIWHTVDSVGQMLGRTATDAARTYAAVPGLAWDLTEPIFTDQNENYGKAFGNFTGRGFSLLTDTQSITGAVLSPVMKADDWAYSHAVSQPMSTVLTMVGHLANTGNVGDLFSSAGWSQAWNVARHRSIGQSLLLTINQVNPFIRIPHAIGLGDEKTQAAELDDPFDPKAWSKYHAVDPLISSIASGAADALSHWELDPGIVLGKGVGRLAELTKARPISLADRLNGISKTADEQTSRTLRLGPIQVGKQGLATRTDALVGKLSNGRYTPGAVDRYADGDLLFHAIPELKANPNGRQIAQLLADTGKYGDNAAAKINARKAILGVAWGDPDAMNRLSKTLSDVGNLRQRVDDAEALQRFHEKGDGMFSQAMAQGLDELGNINAQQTLGLEVADVQDQAVKLFAQNGYAPPVLAWGGDPGAVANAERQVMNLKDLGAYLASNENQLQRLQRVQGTLTVSPRATAAGARAAAAREGKGLLRSGEAATGHETLDRALAHSIGRPLVSLYQSSPTAMPLRIVKTLTVKGIQGPVAVSDLLHNVRPEGMLNLNDIEQTSKELDAMLRKLGTSPETRSDIAAQVARSTSPFERKKIAVKAMLAGRSAIAAKYGLPESEFLDEMDRRGLIHFDSLLSAWEGRAYSAVQVAPQDLSEAQRRAIEANPKLVFRIDHLADDEIPTAMPVLDTAQDASTMPTFDANLLEQTYRRYHRIFKASQAQAVQEVKDEATLGHRALEGARSHDFGLESFYRIKDKTMPVLDELNRVWKFAQLMRLGYLERVLMDDHMRIAAKFGSETLRLGAEEGSHNLWHNHFVSPIHDRYQRKILFTQRALLQDKRGSDELYAANQQAWSRIGAISKKLETVQSTRARAELQNERSVLMDHHPVDLSETDQQLNLLNETIRTGSFKRGNEKGKGDRSIGDRGFTTNGVTGEVYIPGAYEDAYGQTFRQLNSSAGSWAQYGASVESQVHGNLARTGSFKTYVGSDPKHVYAWSEAINNQLRRSRLAKMVMEGKTHEDLVQFLTKTPEGRKMARDMPWQGGNPDRWAQHVEDMVHQYLNTDELRAKALEGDVSPKWLSDHFPTPDGRPDVHGGIMDANLGTGGISHSINSMMNRFYSSVGKSNDLMSRHPLFVTIYRHEAERQAVIYRDAAAKEGRELTGEDVNKISQAAREYARKEVNRTLFEMGATSELQHWVRIVSPFFGAWKEGLDRWWNIIAKDPSAVRKFQLGFDAPRRLGLVVDDKGNPVAPGDSIADNHYILLQVPESWRNGHDHYTSDYRVSESSFNLIFQGGGLFNPGLGPFVQIPANKLAIDNPQYAKQFDFILPLGTSTNTFDPVIPSQLKASWTYFAAAHLNHYSTQYKQFNAMTLRDMMVEFEQNHAGRAPSVNQFNKLLDEANNRTLAMARLKAFSGFTSPASLQIQSKFTPQLESYRRLQDYAYSNNKPFFWADQQFVKQYGEAFFPLIGSAALNNGGLSSTDKTVSYIKDNRHLFNITDPSTYRMIVAGAGDGAYSQAARNYFYTHNMRPGDSTPFVSLSDPRQAMQAQLVNQGWFDYDRFLTKIDAEANTQGLASYIDSPALMAEKKQFIAGLTRKNEAWFQDYSTHNDAQYQLRLDSMHLIAADPGLNADPGRGDVKVLQQYLLLRRAVTGQLAAIGRAGGSASPTAIANRPLMVQFAQAVSNLKESNVWFSKYDFNGGIEFDPYIRAAVA